MYIGNIIVAVGMQHKWHWAIIVVIGYSFAGIQVAAIPAIASTYAVDSYKPVAGPLFVAITVNKNVWGYGFSEFITKWIIKDGYVPPILTNVGVLPLLRLNDQLTFSRPLLSSSGVSAASRSISLERTSAAGLRTLRYIVCKTD